MRIFINSYSALAGFGALIIIGTINAIVTGTTDYTLAEDIIGLVMLGITPLGMGGYMIYRGLDKMK